jgi:hypothetical protein
MTNSDFLTTEDATRFLGVDRRSLGEYRRRELIRPVVLGTTVWWPMQGLLKIAELRQTLGWDNNKRGPAAREARRRRASRAGAP